MTHNQSTASEHITTTMDARSVIDERARSQETITGACDTADGTLRQSAETTKGEHHVDVG